MIFNKIPLFFIFTVFLVQQIYAHSDIEYPVFDSPQNIRLQLKWKHQFQFAGYYAALERGYYEDAGLNVELIEGGLGVDIDQRLADGEAEYGISSAEVVLQKLRGRPFVVLAAIMQHSAQVIITKPDISTPHDLHNKTVMAWQNIANAELVAMALQEGIDATTINIIPRREEIQPFIDGEVDATTGYLTNETFILDQQGIDYNILNPLQYGLDFYGDCLFTTEEELENNPDRVLAFWHASINGWEYAMRHPEEIIQLIKEKYQTNKSIEHLRFEAQKMHNLIMPDVVQIGHMNPGRWEHIAGIFEKLGMVEAGHTLDGFIYNPLEYHGHQDFFDLLIIAVLVLGLTACIVILLILFNYRLKKAVENRTEELEYLNKELSHEIKQHRVTEQELYTEKERLSVLLRCIHEGVIATDTYGNIIIFNNTASLLTEWKEEEALNQNLLSQPGKSHFNQ